MIGYGNLGEILQMASRGDAVSRVQAQLNMLGASLQVDGIFGTLTREAVKAFQQSAGLAPDGIVGPLTQEALDKRTILGPSAGSPVKPVTIPAGSSKISTGIFDNLDWSMIGVMSLAGLGIYLIWTSK